MAQNPKLQVPQIERIRADNTHIADAVQTITNYVNGNTTPAAGNKITPLNPLK
jgi:hypothetical protein